VPGFSCQTGSESLVQVEHHHIFEEIAAGFAQLSYDFRRGDARVHDEGHVLLHKRVGDEIAEHHESIGGIHEMIQRDVGGHGRSPEIVGL